MTESFFTQTTLQPESYCIHKSWGFGKIREINTALDQVIIDFIKKPGHTMKIEYAEDSLEIIPHDHILVLKHEQADSLKSLIHTDPAALIEKLINNLRDQATPEKIHDILCPEILTESGWKKWWDAAKTTLAKSGRFEIPSKKTLPIKILSEAISPQDKALQCLINAKGAQNVLKAIEGLKKFESAYKGKPEATEIFSILQNTLLKAPKSQPALIIELALYRDEWAKISQQDPASITPTLLDLLPARISDWIDSFENLSAAHQTELLRQIQSRRPEEWEANTIVLLSLGNQRLAESIANLYLSQKQPQAFIDILNRLLRERRLPSEVILWLCKTRFPGTQAFKNAHLIIAILSIIEKEQSSENKRSTRLYDALTSDKKLLAELLDQASAEDVRDVTRAIILSPIFKDLDKRSLLAAIIKLHPDVESMVTGENKAPSAQENAALIVSWESLARRKAELEDLINKKIPDNSKEIAIARSYGDLRENHEFKAAKEMQGVLLKRKAELEDAIARSQGTDFKGVTADAVKIGTVVTLKNLSTSEEITYTILGAWDSDPTQGIISYLSALGQVLLNKKVGDSVTIPTEEGTTFTAQIVSIRPYITE